MKTHSRLSAILAVTAVAFAIAGCSPVDQDMPRELQELTANINGKIEPLPTYKPYTATPYAVGNLADPFAAMKVQVAVGDIKEQKGSPDTKRVRDPLESFAVETLQFNGTIVQRGVVHALVTAQDNLYTVKLGDYLGQNFGRVIKISENEIILMEKLQEPSGEWVEHQKPLALTSP
jgi:type IV pilus assembly protein PilP